MRSLVIGTAGHIDHGKSALVKALTGIDPDRLKEEQERGITIDLGFAHVAIGDLQVAFVDVPGHERFIRNMLAGAGGIDAVLLVVAADESVMPQTREHFEICRLLGIERGLIALTKSDLADVDTIELAALEIRELVADSFLARAEILPVSAKTGAGLDQLRAALNGLAGARPRQARAGVVRLPVDRVFSVKGFGTVVTGTLVSGQVSEGDSLITFPDVRPVRIRGIQVHGRPVPQAEAPGRVALNLGGVDAGELSRGVTLATPGSLSVTRRFDARISLVPGARPLRHGARVRVHQGTEDVPGRLAVAATRDPGAVAWRAVAVGERAVSVPPGGEAYVRVRLERPAALARGDRVVLRGHSPTITVGGGIVLDPEPPSGGVRRAATFERFLTLDTDQFFAGWLTEAGLRGLSAQDAVRRGGLEPSLAAALVETLCMSERAIPAGGRVFAVAAVAQLTSRLHQALTDFHEAHPFATGMSREALRETVAALAPQEVFDAVVRDLTARRTISGTDRVALGMRGAVVNAETAQARDTVERLLREAGLMPPDLGTLQGVAGVPHGSLDQIVRLLLREHKVARVGSLLFHSEALARLRDEVRSLKDVAPTTPQEVDVATFKGRYGLSRKFAIPLLEWLDRERVTRRVGDRRIVL